MADAELEVRPPKQRRSREAWNRVLDAGVTILEEDGYEAFTIAAVCERANVAPPAIYARTTSKEALFLAVYEHGIARLVADQQALEPADRWTGYAPAELVRAVVAETVRIPLRHQRFLRPVVLLSASHPEIRRRGSGYSRALGEQFTQLLAPLADRITHDHVGAAMSTCFDTVFATTVIRVAYGPGFATAAVEDDDAFAARLGETAVRYLLSTDPS
ncbi:TetR/AcrR family transcriptional regulator [Cryptosporangium aurantiacum]|uniref:Transcriptional regulator, TetR family n=1 Tax=Cryptosporangium aurantiacum TaxID=134849 RepID=A0A1M7Q0Z2_9ACTN|nr:TetR/AcrR family transcriptional regulator [Cryptosporangium aurantiacum]SHN23833.1 transcriptional regulator, TetR family [Cryptosporangium aurantiacum]